jgi:hypothetical protein
LYTSNTNAGSYSIVKNINICNPNTSASGTVTLYLTQAGTAAGVTNIFLSNMVVAANSSILIDSSVIMNNNAIIAANISLAGMVLNVSGVEFIA